MADKPKLPPALIMGKQNRRLVLYGQGKIDQDEAIQILNQRWTQSRACPICGETNWGVGEELIRLWTSQLKAAYPTVVVTCNTCGYTFFVNAAILGLMPEGKR